MATLQEQLDAACQAGFFCLTEKPDEAVVLYNLRLAAGLEAMTPQEIMDASACYRCNFATVFEAAQAWLLNALNGG